MTIKSNKVKRLLQQLAEATDQAALWEDREAVAQYYFSSAIDLYKKESATRTLAIKLLEQHTCYPDCDGTVEATLKVLKGEQ